MPATAYIELADSAQQPRRPGICIDLAATPARQPQAGVLETLSAADLIARWGAGTADWFAAWMSELNVRNAALGWWAYTSTARNLVSSPLGERVMQVLAIRKLLQSREYACASIRGATPGQLRALRRLLRDTGMPVGLSVVARWGLDRVAAAIRTLARVLWQAARIWLAFLPAHRARRRGPVDYVLLTYVEDRVDPHFDTYFGDLADMIAAARPSAQIACLAYVYTPYRKVLAGLSGAGRERYVPLFAYATGRDILRALARAVRAAFPRPALPASDAQAAAMAEVLAEALREDVAQRGYLHNQLVHACAARIGEALAPRTVIYPYENKSLEKAFLLGVRAGGAASRIIGYQHTSITPRHVTLRFGPGEARITPLPDRIVTVGEVTRRYLEQRGNYPPGILMTGCALRQSWIEPFPAKTVDRERPRVLLALSSSVQELVSAVDLLRRVKERLPGLQLCVRPHVNFPLHMLPPALHDWVRREAASGTGTALRENLAWAEVVAYVSSTVALESLMLGRPVIYLKIDPYDPDPLLDPVRLRWEATDVDGFVAALSGLAALAPADLDGRRNEALAYMKAYLRPKSPEIIAASFL